MECCCKSSGHEKKQCYSAKDTTQLIMVPLEKVVDEAQGIKSFYFKHELKSKPGQFIMLWIPGVGEKPLSIAGEYDGAFFITVSDVGPFSHTLFEAKTGDMLGIRGPLGTSFSLQKKSIALVAGGYGAGPMAFLAELAILEKLGKKSIHYIGGARTKNLLLFEKRIKNLGVHMHLATNDGTYGTKGFVTDVLKELLKKENIGCIYCCGPELMEKAVYDIAKKNDIDCQISVERYMKCGIGICGSCVVDPTGWRMCVEGPVLDAKAITKLVEFGVYHRDATGKKIYFDKR